MLQKMVKLYKKYTTTFGTNFTPSFIYVLKTKNKNQHLKFR